MDFFNKLGKKTTEVYQGAKEKTVKISEEIKLRNKASELKKKIEAEYLEIGKAVYEKMKVGEDALKEEIVPKCEEISRFSDEIEKIEANILALKNIKKCVKCGTALENKAEFCSKCGAEQPKADDVKVEVAEETEVVENAEEASETVSEAENEVETEKETDTETDIKTNTTTESKN